MVVQVTKWNVVAGKAEAYAEWSQRAIPTLLGTPGVVEFRAYRPATGAHQVVVTYEFANLTTWAAWTETEAVQGLLNEAREFVSDINTEVWGPSPIVPDPIRPGG